MPVVRHLKVSEKWLTRAIIKKGLNLNADRIKAMKRIKNKWDEFTHPATIEGAIWDAAKGKKKNRSVRRVTKDVPKYAAKLSKSLKEDKFKLSPFRKDRIKTEYGKVRDVTKRRFFPDRSVEHVIERIMGERWRKSLPDDMYACLPERGINCNIKRHNLNHKLKRAIRSFRGKPIMVLRMDILKCYPNIGCDVVTEMNLRYCKDEKIFGIMEMYNRQTEDLPIGDYLSQQWVNPVLMPLVRFCKEELKIKHFFIYLDDIIILHDDKAELHQWQWRIMNFLWYRLGLECNNKRQIFPLGKTKIGRGIAYAGYVFRHDYTLLRKRIKNACVRRRHNPKSVSSYLGLLKHCDGRNLIDKILNRDNDMDLASLIGKKIERPFEGEKINIEAVVDQPITICNFEIKPSDKKPGTDYLKMQIEFNGKKRFIGGGYKFLCEVLKLIDKSNLPLQTIIRNKRGYYFEGTIDE